MHRKGGQSIVYAIMDEHIYKSHNKSLLLYHLVFPAKYRRKIFSDDVEITLKNICVGISHCYEVNFIEIGVDEDHVHFLIQSVPMLSVTQLVKMLKSITARKLFLAHPEIKEQLWGGSLWTSGFYVNTVGQYASKDVIKRYVAEQGKYKRIHQGVLDFDMGATS